MGVASGSRNADGSYNPMAAYQQGWASLKQWGKETIAGLSRAANDRTVAFGETVYGWMTGKQIQNPWSAQIEEGVTNWALGDKTGLDRELSMREIKATEFIGGYTADGMMLAEAAPGLIRGAGSLLRGGWSMVKNLPTMGSELLSSAKGLVTGEAGTFQRLASAGDDLIRAFERSGNLTASQIERLLAKAQNGLVVDEIPSPQKLWQLTQKTGVEWGVADINGVARVYSGKASEILMRADGSTTVMQHVHPTTHLPSMADYNVWQNLKNTGAQLETLDIIHKGELLRYTSDVLEILKAGKLLR